ncbi:MAG: lytic transglycosylase domain-containing protein [Holosporales bacterium]|nr:lytic transglycosylase domain-containing protein [Holosporales bacterium]
MIIFFRVLVISLFLIGQVSAAGLEKLEKWKVAIRNPSNHKNVFSFFYYNPHWPLFQESVKEAERNIPIPPTNSPFLLTWFKRHPPMTGDGTIAHAYCLLQTDPELGKLYIKQNWIFQNFSDDFAVRYREEFEKYLTPIEDARRAKRLMAQNKIPQLIAMKKMVIPQIAEYIALFLRQNFAEKSSGFSAKDLQDPRKKLNIVQGLIDRKQITKAADILAMSNRNEEQYEQDFFNQRRYVAYEILRSGNPRLSYQVMEKCKLQNHQNNENHVKAKWLLGYISYRFLKDYDTAIDHFEDAYNNSRTAIRLSKNACWLAEVHRAKNDIVPAIEWYKKAAIHFNTFYGYVAHHRLSGLPSGRFSVIDDIYANDFSITPTDLEVRFYGRELVQTLMEISKSKSHKRYAKDFYRQLVKEIEDPNEELLLLDIAIAHDELPTLISTISRKQHFFVGKRAYRVLNNEEMGYIRNVKNDLCFYAIVHSVIQSESNFNANAVSHVGAVGLMQIMPTTADYEMSRIKFYIGQGVPLSNRKKNILIGSSILSRLLHKYNGNIVYAVAAYNCGEGNLSKFQKSISKLKGLSSIDLMELIPYKETRIYVKHVLRSLFEYQNMFGPSDCYGTSNIANFDQVTA